ncbi:hypothetical protein Dimus_033158 [Dionaea muscipula]
MGFLFAAPFIWSGWEDVEVGCDDSFSIGDVELECNLDMVFVLANLQLELEYIQWFSIITGSVYIERSCSRSQNKWVIAAGVASTLSKMQATILIEQSKTGPFCRCCLPAYVSRARVW